MRHVSCRRGFTLLELLIVMAIAATLMTLMVASVMRAFIVVDNVQDYSEVAQLHAAMLAFCQDPKWGSPGYVPSKFDPSGTDPASKAYIKKIWPATGGTTRLPSQILEGHQVLVLFLGGARMGDNGVEVGVGWSSDSEDPVAMHGQRIKYYDFKESRLKGSQYRWYEDRHGTPIAYFCPKGGSAPGYAGSMDHCISLPGGPKPYLNVNLSTFQIISAGPDKFFGQKGDIWSATARPPVYIKSGSMADPGYDDVANFCRRLGTP